MISDAVEHHNQNTEFDNDRVMTKYNLFNMKLIFFVFFCFRIL